MKTTIFTFLFYPLFLFAQNGWLWQNPLPQGNTINNIQFINENVGWMMGDFGAMLKTYDGGNTWQFLKSNTRNMIYSFQFVSEDTGWACGYEGIILKSIDGGENWIVQDSGRAWFINSIFFTDINDGWAVDAESRLFHTTNGGDQWSVQNFPGEYFYSVYFLNQDYGWICGNNGIYKTSDSGLNWLYVSVPLRYGINKVFFIDTLSGWAIGNLGLIAKTTDGGLNWQEQLYTDSDNFYSIKFSNSLEGFIVGSFGRVYHTSDGGHNWDLKTLKYHDLTLYDIYISDKDNFIIVGADGLMFKSTDQGTTWHSQDILGFYYFKDLQFIDDKNGWLIGSSDTSVVYKTTDGGKTWNYNFSYNGGVEKICFVDKYKGWMVGDWGNIYQTDDGGENWKKDSLPDLLPYNDIKFFKNGLGFLISPTSAIAYKSTDFGRTWTRMNFPVSIDYEFQDLCFIDEKNGWIISHEWLTPHHKILRTKDSGDTWQIEYEINTEYLWDMFFYDRDRGWIVGDSGIVIYTSDMGNEWNVIHNNIPEYFFSVYFNSPFTGYASGSKIFATTDGGQTWVKENINCNYGINKITSPDGKTGIAVGSAGTIITNNNLITSIGSEDNYYQESFYLKQNYPNPFNPVTKIKYTIPQTVNPLPGGARGGFTTLKVYDILGREIATLVNEQKPAGEYEVEFNAANLPSGIYFYQLNAGVYRETRKMVLIR